jgi:integrase
MKTKLDAKVVASLGTLPDGKSEEFFWDAALDRFGLRLRRGTGDRVLRSWVIQYRRVGGNRRMTIGDANALPLEQARAAARKALAKVDLGEDPAGDKAERRDKDKLLFRTVAAEYLAAKEDDLRANTFRGSKAILTGPYFKPLHNMPIDRIGRRDVAARFVVIARENGKAAAALARSKLSGMFVWALQQGLCELNPVAGTARPEVAPARDRVLSDEELAAVWRGCDATTDFSRIIRLLTLLPCRRQEVGGMRWDELDLERGVWTIPAARAKNGRAITLPLMPMALEIIKAVPQRVECDRLFGERHSPKGFTSWFRGKESLDAKTGIDESWNIHDLRRSVATRMADLGVAPHVVEQILNHVSGHKSGVAGIYNRSSYEREVKQALGLWEDHVNALVAGGQRKVIALNSSRVL